MNPLRSGWAILGSLILFLTVARGQSDFTGPSTVQSVSGQFAVSSQEEEVPAYRRLNLATNSEIIQLKPSFLAVSAERFKMSVWRQLGLKPDATWRGKIYLVLRPAQWQDDAVTIRSSPFLNVWAYRVELPDTMTRTRYARALTAVLLLEMANRNAPANGHSAEIPAWLTDGLARQTLAVDGEKIILSTPARSKDGLPQSRLEQIQRGIDPLAVVRRCLDTVSALTFDQLSWPGDPQLNGYDGGAYHASAQLFVTELLGLKNGAARLRFFLNDLHARLNWQSAFFAAFSEDFKRPLDVEKWWALRAIRFAARDPGPHWTPAASRDQLAGLLTVPVEFRDSSNSLPAHAEISLQTAIRSFDAAQQSAVLQTKLRDLALAQMRLTPPFAALADGYWTALADFLGEPKKSPIASSRSVAMRRTASVADTLKKLDDLDARRRATEAVMKPNLFRP